MKLQNKKLCIILYINVKSRYQAQANSPHSMLSPPYLLLNILRKTIEKFMLQCCLCFCFLTSSYFALLCTLTLAVDSADGAMGC